MNDEPINVAVLPDMCEDFRARAKALGIEQGSKKAWSQLKREIEDSKAIAPDEIHEFTIHLRILADLYLSFAMGEANYPKFVEQCKTIRESQQAALSDAKKLKSRLSSDAIKSVLPPGSKLTDELYKTIDALEIAVDQHIPPPSRNPVKRADHALAQSFELLWECYKGTPLKGNQKAYSIAKLFFRNAGCMPRTKAKGAGELKDISQKFDKARERTEGLGPLTPARKLTRQEREIYSYWAF